MRKIPALFLLAMAGCATPVPTRESIADNVVSVNYNATVDSLIKAGRHDGKYFLLNSNINSKNFSLTATGEKRVRILLEHFDKKPMTHLEILDALKTRHLRPANTQEFLCFVQQCNWGLKKFATALNSLSFYSEESEEESEMEIVCLGASYQPKNSFYSEVLHWRMSYDQLDSKGLPVPVLDLTWLELNWLPNSYFAVVSTDLEEEDAEIKPKTIEFK